MGGTSVVDLIEEQAWVEPVSEALASGTKSSFELLGALSRPVRNFLHGTWLGHPLHPVVTDIPLGAWTVAAALDTAEMYGVASAAPGADAAVAIGLAGAVLAALSGLNDWHLLEQGSRPKKVGAVHALLNIMATAFYGSSLLLRSGQKRGIARALSAVGYGLVGISAYLGGTLVYDQKIGVDHAPRSGFPNDWTAVGSEGDLQEGANCRKAGKVEIVIVKGGSDLFALANGCSHLGGPLCEGSVDGQSIVCPWHESRFDLRTGNVLDGPATAPQPVFETRVRSGNVEVRTTPPQPKTAE